MTVVVDPYLIAIPNGRVQEGDIRAYANRLLEWDCTFRSNPDFVFSSQVICVIYSLGLEPSWSNLNSLFEKYGIRDLDARDIAEGCQILLTNLPHMEDRVSSLNIISIDGKENVIPPQFRQRLHPKIAEVFVDALVKTSYALNIMEKIEPIVWNMATAPLGNEVAITEMIVEGSVNDYGTEATISRLWSLVYDPGQISIDERISDVYPFDLYKATELAWKEMKEGKKGLSTLPWIERTSYFFGPRFLRSISESNIRYIPSRERDIEMVFEAIVHVLTSLWSYPSDKHHPLRRIIQDRKSKQIIRLVPKGSGIWNKDKAARVEIIGGKNCLHLHYWQCHDGKYEFSNITTAHDDPKIYE